MQTQSFYSQTPLFQGFPPCQVLAPLKLQRSTKEACWVSSGIEVPVFVAETPSQMLHLSFGEGDKGGEDQRFNLCKSWGIIQHLITNNQYDCLLELIQKLLGDQAFGTYLNDFYAGNKNANFPTFFAHTRNRLELSELYIYGSGRLGNLEQNLVLHAGAEQQAVWNPFVEDPSHLADSLLDEHESIASTPEIYTTSATHKSFVIGQKRYEISNHLGNVSSVITDRKFGVPVSGTDPTINYYLADIVSATDYDPYGQALPGRVWNRSGYRFGFNGQELDSELGEVWSAEFWEYDASLGRRWDIDPIDLPWQSPYVAFDCNPIAFSDPMGLAAAPTGDGDGDKKKGKKSRDMRTSDEAKSDATSQKGASLSPENKNRVDITQKGFWNRPEKSWRKDLKVSAQDKDGRVMYKTPGGTWVDIDEHSGTVRAFDETEKHWRDVWDRDTWNKRTDSNRNAAAAEFTDWIRDLLITALSFELETAAFRMVIPKVATSVNKIPKVNKAILCKKSASNVADDVLKKLGCFVVGTPIFLHDKPMKPIEKLLYGKLVVRWGDVLSRNHVLQTPEEKPFQTFTFLAILDRKRKYA